MPLPSDNFSTLLQFLHQELLGSDNHDATKENLLAYFQDAGCDKSQLDIVQTSFHKATLDTKAFSRMGMGDDQQPIAPAEFSQRLVNELTKKYNTTKVLQHRINQLEDLCAAAEPTVSLDDAVAQFSKARLSSHNLEAAMIDIANQTLGTVRKSEGRGNTRHSGAYDEHILTLRKKLNVSDTLFPS
jgi:hypothetical protein